MYIRFVYLYGPLANFAGNSVFLHVYRPLAAVTTWVFYALFGLDMSAWRATQLAVFGVGLASLYFAFSRVAGSRLVGLLVALLYAVNPTINELMLWIVETTALRAIFAGALIFLLTVPAVSVTWILGVLGILFVAPFAKENSLAMNAGVFVYAVLGAWRRWLARPLALWLAAANAVLVALYFGLRALVVGATTTADSIANDGSMFFTYYTGAEVRAFAPLMRLGYHAYAVMAHLISTFVPIFDSTGKILPGAIFSFAYVGLLMVCVVFLPLWAIRSGSPDRREPGSAISMTRGPALAFLGFALPWILLGPIELREYLDSALQGALSLGIAAVLFSRLPWTREQKLMTAFAIAMILAMSVLGFPFFRQRVRDFALVGWLVLLAVSFARLNANARARALRATMAVLAVFLLIISSGIVHDNSALGPVLLPFLDPTGALCQPSYPGELAAALVQEYGMDLQALHNCRQGLAP